MPKVSRGNVKKSPLEAPTELQHLEKNISTIETSLEENVHTLISPHSYAEKMKLTPNTNGTEFQRSRNPQEQTLVIIGDFSHDVLS